MPRISQLPSLTTADNADEIAIVDVSASTTKKITRGDLLKSPLPTNSVTTAAVVNKAITADKVDFTTAGVQFFVANALSITFTTNVKCIIEVEAYVNATWGFAGGVSTLSINTPSGLTAIIDERQTINGGDVVEKNLMAKKILTGATAGMNITITAAQSNSGSTGSPRIIVKCYPIN